MSRKISPREKDLLRLLITGATNKLIASELGITANTVKVYLVLLRNKIDSPQVRNRTQMAMYAVREGYQPWIFRKEGATGSQGNHPDTAHSEHAGNGGAGRELDRQANYCGGLNE